MFSKYVEKCCLASLPDPEAEVVPLEPGTIRIQWAEFPFVENDDESPLDGDGSRPSSGASRVVQKSRNDTISPKDLPTTMIYSLGRPPPQDGDADPKPILGLVQGAVEQVEEVAKKLQEVQYLIDVHRRDHEGEELGDVLQAQIQDALCDVWNFFQASAP